MTLALEFTAWRALHFDRRVLRLGWLTLWWCPGSAINEMARMRLALDLAAHELRK